MIYSWINSKQGVILLVPKKNTGFHLLEVVVCVSFFSLNKSLVAFVSLFFLGWGIDQRTHVVSRLIRHLFCHVGLSKATRALCDCVVQARAEASWVGSFDFWGCFFFWGGGGIGLIHVG